jgi:hypothetical protein
MAQHTLAQGPQNSISGTVTWTYNPGTDYGSNCTQQLTGTLDSQGNLTLDVQDGDGCSGYGEKWAVLNSGDATSQGWFWEPNDTQDCEGNAPPSNFLNDLGK